MTIYKLAENANLHIIQESKFKTVRIMVRFRERLSEKTVAKRVLISNLLETTNAKYPTSQAFSKRLSELYGTSFSTGVTKKGTQHFLTINMSLVNPKFLDEDILTSAIDFLKTALFHPDVDKNGFNTEVFRREQSNLIHYLESMMEDNSYQAGRKISELYFDEKTQSLPSVGTVELLKNETAESVYDYFQEMLTTNAIDIFVLGDVNETAVKSQFVSFKFDHREFDNSFFYTQDLTDFREQTDEKEAAQSILQLAYHLPVKYGDDDYMAVQLLNGILGAFAHSKLFVNVREKAQLAYTAHSYFDSFTGVLSMSMGIDDKNFEQAVKLAKAQFSDIQAGNFSDEDIRQTKLMLKNTYFVQQDSPAVLIEQAFTENLFPEAYMSTEKFIAALEKTTKADIVKVANKIKLQAQYYLKGVGRA